VDKGLSADPPEEVDWWPRLWGEVPTRGNEVVGVIDW